MIRLIRLETTAENVSSAQEISFQILPDNRVLLPKVVVHQLGDSSMENSIVDKQQQPQEPGQQNQPVSQLSLNVMANATAQLVLTWLTLVQDVRPIDLNAHAQRFLMSPVGNVFHAQLDTFLMEVNNTAIQLQRLALQKTKSLVMLITAINVKIAHQDTTHPRTECNVLNKKSDVHALIDW